MPIERALSSFGMAITLVAGLLSGAGERTGNASQAVTPDLQSPSAAVPAARPIARGHDGLFRIEAHLNDAPCRLVLDTGANVTVLSPRDAMRAGLSLAMLRYDETLETGGGKVPVARVTVARLHVAGRELTDVPVLVPKRDFLASVLGQDVVARLGPIAIQGDWLVLNERPAAGPIRS